MAQSSPVVELYRHPLGYFAASVLAHELAYVLAHELAYALAHELTYALAFLSV